MRNPGLTFAVKTAAAALLTMIVAASWALIANQRVLSSTVNVPVSHQTTAPLLPFFTPPPVKLPPVYRVHPGDTLWGISQHAHMSWQALYALNRETVGGNPNLIYPGETLRL